MKNVPIPIFRTIGHILVHVWVPSVLNVNTVWAIPIYDPESCVWSALSNMQNSRGDFAIEVLNDNIVVVGGQDFDSDMIMGHDSWLILSNTVLPIRHWNGSMERKTAHRHRASWSGMLCHQRHKNNWKISVLTIRTIQLNPTTNSWVNYYDS